MLKGTLERKKIGNHVEKEAIKDSTSFGYRSGQSPSAYESPRKQVGNAKGTENGCVDKGAEWRKQRKELKHPQLHQTRCLLKRCENLEKEVRPLKLNLAFMNRKDGDQK
ncbi:hypothetical protein L6452_32119 [Arctium lappa]|uniref:Uncharacterized protein n=1 Tax=Arctium lappa TaxID=4217 RepID=A0ACB8Z7Y0_ARCLA|nr:hypothetical protein L6452_32119 [Arctium lappa]